MGTLIKDRKELQAISVSLHQQGRRIVTTNGVFDLVHVGHIRFLQFCKSQGDILMVGVNADSSVKQFKGDKRPILPDEDRAELVAALFCVDYVHVFSERTPETWLDIVKPAVHVKAGDYTLDREKESPKTKVWERDVVEKNGGICCLAPLNQGKSTTAIISKIVDVYGNLKTEKARAVFLDRDGTIIQDKGYMHKVEDLEFISGAVDALKKLSDSGFKLIVLSNQSGLARGVFTDVEYERFHQHFISYLAENGVKIDGVYMCPHHPLGSREDISKDCMCRKPRPGMIISALKEHNIDLEKSFVVGDKTGDILLGNNIGIRAVLVKTGKGGSDGEFEAKAACTVTSIIEAADWILSRR